MHRLIVYVFLVTLYLTAFTTASSKPSSNLNFLNSFPNTLPVVDQIPIRNTMSYTQPGYRSVAYFVVSHINPQVKLSLQTLMRPTELGHLWSQPPASGYPRRQTHPCPVRFRQRSP